jgi:hypothetical protein
MNLALEQIIWMLGNAFLAKISFERNSNFMGWVCLVSSAFCMSKVLLFIF